MKWRGDRGARRRQETGDSADKCLTSDPMGVVRDNQDKTGIWGSREERGATMGISVSLVSCPLLALCLLSSVA